MLFIIIIKWYIVNYLKALKVILLPSFKYLKNLYILKIYFIIFYLLYLISN